MRNPPAAFKHADPTHLEFGKSADSSLLAKKRQGFADGGSVGADLGVLRSREVRRSDTGANEVQGLADGGEVENDPAGQASLVPPGMRPGGVAKMAKAYPGWPTMSIDPAWENHPKKKSSYERTNPDWGTAI